MRPPLCRPDDPIMPLLGSPIAHQETLAYHMQSILPEFLHRICWPEQHYDYRQKAAFMCATFCLTCRGAAASVCFLFQDGPHATPTSALKDEAACARLFRWHSGRCKVSNSTASGPEAPCIVSLPCVYFTMAPPKIINSHYTGPPTSLYYSTAYGCYCNPVYPACTPIRAGCGAILTRVHMLTRFCVARWSYSGTPLIVFHKL